jgi:spore germination protein KC
MISFLLTGCWDARQVNNLNLCTMVILDKIGDEFAFTVEIAKIAPSGESGGGGGQKKQTYMTGSGKSLSDAREDVDMQMDSRSSWAPCARWSSPSGLPPTILRSICSDCGKTGNTARR